jgi:DNA repair protein RadD
MHQKRDQQKISRLVECSQCSALRTGGEPCEDCGFFPKRRPDAIVFADGELVRLDKKCQPIAVRDPHDQLRWHAQLTFIAQQRRYKAGWAAHKFKERFGHWPPRSAPPPMEPSPEVLSWVRSRAIAFAKAQQKATAA